MCHRDVFPRTLRFGIPVAVGHDQLQSVMMPKESSILSETTRKAYSVDFCNRRHRNIQRSREFKSLN